MEHLKDKLDRRSQPSRVTLKDGRVVRVVSSRTAGGKIVQLGIDPLAPGEAMRWIQRSDINMEAHYS